MDSFERMRGLLAGFIDDLDRKVKIVEDENEPGEDVPKRVLDSFCETLI